MGVVIGNRFSMSISSAVTGLFFSPIFGRGGPADDSARKTQAAPPAPTTIASAETTGLDTKGASTVGSTLSALLGSLGLSGPDGTGRAMAPAEDTQAIRPNLDALNRVLNHYRAQSEALGTVVGLAD